MKKTIASILISICLIPSLASAAITIDNGPTFSGSNGFSFTVTAGTNLALVVFVDALNNDTTACTYNSVAMTQVNTNITNVSDHLSMWRLVAPSTGANTVSCTTVGSSYRGLEAIAYTGVDQTTPIDGSATASSNSVSITTSVTGDFFAGNGFSSSGAGPCPTTPYTTFTAIDIGTLYTSAGAASAGATTLAFTCTSGVPTLDALAVKPAASANIIALYTFWDF